MARFTFCTGVRKGAAAEPEAARMYKRLVRNAPNARVARIIRRIRADEIMHRRIFVAIKKRFC